jgi:hypothetical protein
MGFLTYYYLQVCEILSCGVCGHCVRPLPPSLKMCQILLQVFSIVSSDVRFVAFLVV